MCFQGYVHWRCGHVSMHEEECALATTLETPFWLKVSCPNYHIQRRAPDRLCGKGAFYCSQTQDGHELDRMHVTQAKIQEVMQHKELQISGRKGLQAYGQSVGDEILRRGGNKDDCNSDPTVVSVYQAITKLMAEISNLRHHEKALANSIQSAKTFFERQARFISGTGPPLVQMPRGLYPPSFQGPLRQQQQHRPGLTSLAGAVSRAPGRMDRLSGQHHAGGVPTGSYHASGFPTGTYNRRQAPQSSVPGVQPFPQKRSQTQKKLEEAPSSEKSTPPVRRSGRVRNKKVTYAESESDPFTRSPSPEKDDDDADSNFSPNKSEPSPCKTAKATRNNSNLLVDMIGEFKKREASKIPDNKSSEPPKWPIDAKFQKQVQNWVVNRYDADLKVPPAGQTVKTQEWSVNKYDADTTLPPPAHPEAGPKNMDYQSLKQTLNAPMNLPGKELMKHESAEPQKRRMPAPSAETLSSSKKMKLTLPGTSSGFSSGKLTSAPVLAPPVARKTVPNVKVEAVIPTPVEEEDVDSSLSDIDWGVLEEGVLED